MGRHIGRLVDLPVGGRTHPTGHKKTRQRRLAGFFVFGACAGKPGARCPVLSYSAVWSGAGEEFSVI